MEPFPCERAEPRGSNVREPHVYWRWFKWKLTKDGWEPTDTGWLLTLSLFVLVFKIGLLQDAGVAKVDQFITLKPSEMGDTLAGLFSALAFIWIIVTVFIQSRELRETRIEVKQQRLASQEMARAMSLQAEIFEDERKYRSEARAKAVFEELLISQRTQVTEIGSLEWRMMEYEFLDLMIARQQGTSEDDVERSECSRVISFRSNEPSAEYTVNAATGFREFRTAVEKMRSEHVLTSPSREKFLELKRLLNSIGIVEKSLSRDQLIRSDNLCLPMLDGELRKILDLDIWRGEVTP